jgi:hypothetical protein
MSLSSPEQQRLAKIEAELSTDRHLVLLAGYVGKRAARLRWLLAVGVVWIGLPLAVGATGGLITALVLHVPLAASILVPILVLLWPSLACAGWRRWRLRTATGLRAV